MNEVLNVSVRQQVGTRNSRRLRARGQIPAVLYGHEKETINLSVPEPELTAAIRHGARVVDLKGAANDSALIRELQWDPFGMNVLHIDFTRVDAGERIATQVRLELRGEAPGSREGGIVTQPIHALEIECRAAQIPESIEININDLEVDQSITAGDIPLEKGVKLITDPNVTVVSCAVAVEEAEEQELAEISAEPEVIGQKAEEEEGGE